MKKRVFHNPVIGDKATLVKSSDDTRGEYTLMEIEVVPGGGNIPHTHETYSEKFTVIDGRLSVLLGDKTRELLPGQTLTVPAKAIHCFSNKSTRTTTFLVEFRPAQPGFERAIAILYGLAADGLSNKQSLPKNFRHMAIVMAISNMSPTGFVKLLMPLFKLIASLSKRTEAQLISKYC